MTPVTIPLPLVGLLEAVVPVIRHAYEVNADRHDPLVGDDLNTFAFNVYRNSWHLIEEAVRDLDGWETSRPDGSLLITDGGYRVHVYRAGANELVDLDALRFDREAASLTKRSIASANSAQLAFEFEEFEREALVDVASHQTPALCEVVILHAGNPEDAMCAVWVGAPVANGSVAASPWAWKYPVAVAQRATSVPPVHAGGTTPAHDELPEPAIDLVPVEDRGIAATAP